MKTPYLPFPLPNNFLVWHKEVSIRLLPRGIFSSMAKAGFP